MWKYLFLVIITCLSVPISSKADISATTTIQRFQGVQPLGNPTRLAGSRVAGSWTEAFVDFLQFANYLRGALSGSPFESIGAYREFNQFLDAAGDKGAAERSYTHFVHGSGGDRIRLRFQVTSDDDPIGIARVAYPNEGIYAGAFYPPRVSGTGSRSANVTLDLTPGVLSAGSYPLYFYTKETDCQMCLSIAHSIRLTISNPRACGPRPPVCRNYEQARDRAESLIRARQDENQSLIQRAYEGGGAHAAINYEKNRLRICARLGPSGTPLHDRCVSAIPDLSGLCRQVAYAVRQDPICRRLGSIREEVERLTRDREQAQATLSSPFCCPKPID